MRTSIILTGLFVMSACGTQDGALTIEAEAGEAMSLHFDDTRGTTCHTVPSVCLRNRTEEPIRVVAVRAEAATTADKPLARGSVTATPNLDDRKLPLTLSARDGYACVPVTVCTDWSTWDREMGVTGGAAPLRVELQFRGHFVESELALEHIGAGKLSVAGNVSASAE